MKDIKIKVSRETRMVEINKYVIGNDGENLQGNLVFTFDEFVDGQARLEYKISGSKYFAPLERINESYQIPILSVITKKGQIDMQLVVTEGINETEIPIFKSNIFYLNCNASINAEAEQPDEFEQWIEIANAKLNQVDNLDIDAAKEDGVTTITITKKDGTQESVEIYDGDAGTGGGTSDYLQLENKPFINNVELIGNKTLEDLNIQPKGNYLTEVPSEYVTETELNDTIKDKANKNEILTKTSQLENDSNYVTEQYVDDKVGAINTILATLTTIDESEASE